MEGGEPARRWPAAALVTVAVAVVLLAGCSGGDATSSTTTAEVRAVITTEPVPSSAQPVPPPTSAPSSTVPAPPATPAGEVSIRAVVGATFASARVIMLAEPVAGFTQVAFTAQTRYLRAGGGAAALADLTPGASVEVKGQRSSATALLAREVVIL